MHESPCISKQVQENVHPHNFEHLVTLQGTGVCLIEYLAVHQMKYVMER